MSTLIDKKDNRSGAVLMVVMGMITLGTLAVFSIMNSALNKMRLADIQVCTEQAFYVAQAGAERAATSVSAGNEYTATLKGKIGLGDYVSKIICQPGSGGEIDIDIISTGTVKGKSRTVSMHGVRRVSWARYALWYDDEALKLWIAPGEKFGGRVYSRPQFHFHHQDLASKGQVVFSEPASSGASSIERSNSSVNPIFLRGLTLNAERENMASVSFPDMLATAQSGGLVLDGPTTIELRGNQMRVTNDEAGYSSTSMNIPANGMVYVRSAKVNVYTDVYNKKTKKYVKTLTGTKDVIGDASVSGPTGLQGRLTIVADNNVNITDHIRYKTNPRTNPNSTDALGLVAQKNIVVATTTPDNVDIYAHMIAVDGGFGVKDYSTIRDKGYLNVFGGIVNEIRNAVGVIGSSGYSKNYEFDVRFAKNPPPNYPKLADELEWSEWEG